MKKILYLGDNPYFFNYLKENTAYRFHVVKNVETAVSVIASEHFHLCIVDCQNSLAGADFVRKVRLEQKWNAPIIFIATYPIALLKIHLEAFTVGNIQFIEKPCDFDTGFDTQAT